MDFRHVLLAIAAALAATSVGVAAESVSSRHQQTPPLRLDQPLDIQRLVGRPATTNDLLVVGAPGEVEFSIVIKPTDRSRELRIVADSGTFYRSTSIELHGAESEALHSFTWRGFPEGDYSVVGLLIDDSGNEELTVHAAMKVIGR